MVVGMHHQATRKNSDAAFEDAHIYVHLEAGYILTLKKGLGKGDDRHVRGAQKFLHISGVGQIGKIVEPQSGVRDKVCR